MKGSNRAGDTRVEAHLPFCFDIRHELLCMERRLGRIKSISSATMTWASLHMSWGPFDDGVVRFGSRRLRLDLASVEAGANT